MIWKKFLFSCSCSCSCFVFPHLIMDIASQISKRPCCIPQIADMLVETRGQRTQSDIHVCVAAMLRHSQDERSIISALAAADHLIPKPLFHWTEWRVICRAMVCKDPMPSRTLVVLALNVLVSGGRTAALQMTCTPGMDSVLLLLGKDDRDPVVQALALGAFAAMGLAAMNPTPPTLAQTVLEKLPKPFVADVGHFPRSMKCIVCLQGAADSPDSLWRALPCACVLHAECFALWTKEDNTHFWARTQCLVCRADLTTTALDSISWKAESQ